MHGTVVTTTRPRFNIGIILSILVVLIGFIPLYLFSVDLQRERGYRFDIYPRYVGAQAVWAGESPYAQAVTERIQIGMYGQLQPPDADQQRFAHPAYSAVFLAPLLLFSPEVAIPIWISLQFVALFATPFLWFSILRWKPRPLTLALLVIGVIFVFRYPVLSYVWGQFTGGIVFLFSLAVWLLQKRRDGWAGMALALATVPPSMSGPLAILLLGALLLTGRWRGMAVFVALLGVATLISVARIGWWLPDFVHGLSAYSIYAHPVSAADFLPSFLRLPYMIVIVVAVMWSGWQVIRERANRRSVPISDTLVHFLSVISLACLLLLPQTGNYYLVLGIPILMICAWQARRMGRWGWIVGGMIVVTIFSPWLWVAISVPDVETLVTPSLLAITLGVTMGISRRHARS